MRKIRESSTKSVAQSWLDHFRNVARTNRYAKGNEYKMTEETRVNTLGFKITYYIINQTK